MDSSIECKALQRRGHKMEKSWIKEMDTEEKVCGKLVGFKKNKWASVKTITVQS